MSDENTTEDMTKKLKAAGKKAERAKTERQARAVKGSHLNPQLLQAVADAGLEQEEMSGFIKVTAANRSGKLYIAKKGGRVDLAFELQAPGIKQITEEEAKQRHLGKIRGQLDFEQADDVVLTAFGAALAAIATSPEVVRRPAKAAAPAEAQEPEATPEPEAAAG